MHTIFNTVTYLPPGRTIGEHFTQGSAFFDNIDVHLICCFKSNTLQLLGHYVHKLCCPNQGDCWKINSLVLLMYKLLGWLVLQLYTVEFIVVCITGVDRWGTGGTRPPPLVSLVGTT